MKLVVYVMLLMTVGCAHINVEGYDTEKGTISLSATKFTSDEAMLEVAKKHCGGAAHLISVTKEVSGSIIEKGYDEGRVNQTLTSYHVYTYKCDR